MGGNCVRNGHDRRPKHARSCTFENFYGQCTVKHRALWNQWWHGWWAQRLGVAETACRVGVLCADSMNTCMVVLQRSAYRFFKSASFSERVLPVSGFLSLSFLTRFPHVRCHILGQGFGNKMYISELFTVVGFLHRAGFKNCRGINCVKCRLLDSNQFHSKKVKGRMVCFWPHVMLWLQP